jgi:alpha-glucosidase
VSGGQAAPWWQGAVVYQIYPRSFCDSNADGIGDLKGIESKLDYIASLGVDAIWLSPIHPSPNRDFGYDVADFNGIAPEMGTMADFERLIAEAHRRRLKVILDEVLSHTSDLHPWFQESLKSRTGDKADWYVWADPREDGTPPNNWLSVFGGPAWSYHPLRRQYYFHKFLKQQPKVNLYNADARKAAIDVLKFWLDRGVDGFRLDVANSYLHDAQLRDNPAVPITERTAQSATPTCPRTARCSTRSVRLLTNMGTGLSLESFPRNRVCSATSPAAAMACTRATPSLSSRTGPSGRKSSPSTTPS